MGSRWVVVSVVVIRLVSDGVAVVICTSWLGSGNRNGTRGVMTWSRERRICTVLLMHIGFV